MSITRRCLTAGVTLIASAGFCGTAQAAVPDELDRLQYVALGDSYSSGEGLDSYDLNKGCHRSSRAYPTLYASRRPRTQVFHEACTGARTDQVYGQMGPLSDATQLVTISAGGNDVGFGDTITACVTRGCYDRADESERKIRQELPGKLDRLYADIKRRARNAKVVAMGYPRLFGPASCDGARGIQIEEQRRLNELADVLANTIYAATLRAGIDAIDVRPGFDGHGVCESEWVRGLSVDLQESFHPNDAGHDWYYRKLRAFAP